MNKGKRILSITIKRMLDDSPDTSHLGEYSNSPDEYSIDRGHSLDCARNTGKDVSDEDNVDECYAKQPLPTLER